MSGEWLGETSLGPPTRQNPQPGPGVFFGADARGAHERLSAGEDQVKKFNQQLQSLQEGDDGRQPFGFG
ncbi:hypothetical protein E5F05_19930 [Deinococcus metallilatus]|uniref:Uncharacterized protein n=1 Tax=Deinococcus metallilatus TaxID=1211322 RepID=A0AAJ5JY34_9DEIO|nr:hypothetical protein [Deinococcus metallilatus]MBB5296306.1 hypothetical protein [Deinococcus metallilatus]QBY10010.1 hypothetical protein E5F05_19930 [Deinococcus metallilatus]RXJ08734.1 hypothetical protein ERJ73_18770 [Deinococcus metallilatus]TLK25208.1 hypothetical protein FCS05_13685 [Deinococcus metallilatus]